MAFSLTAIFTLETADAEAPGAPGITAVQDSNTQGTWTLTAPTEDADGSPLTGLTFGQIVVAQISAEDAEDFRDDFEGAMELPDAQNFREDGLEPGDVRSASFAIAEPGSPYTVFARVADHTE